MTRKFLLLTTALTALLSSTAFAADLGVAPLFKAPPSTGDLSGGYVGFGTEAAVASANVSGNVFPSNLTASGGAIGGDLGYVWNVCFLKSWCQVELDGKYQNISATGAGGSVASHWSVSGEFDIGADVIQTLGTYFPNLNTVFPSFNPTTLLPAAAVGNVSVTPKGYVGFKGELYGITGTVGSASGQTVSFGPGVTAGWRWQTLTNGTPNGGSLKVFADTMWLNRGVDVTGVFAQPGGAPINVQSHNGLNTLFRVGVHYDFAVK
jgi:hypothetical protein